LYEKRVPLGVRRARHSAGATWVAHRAVRVGMHKSDKAPEPTMEEILASIRKIIAEEPIGSRPGPSPSSGDGSETAVSESKGLGRGSDPVLPLPSRNDDPSDDRAYSVEEALSELMDGTPQRRAAAGREEPAVKPPAEEEKRGSWLFGRQPSPPSGTQQQSSSGGSGLLGGGLLGQLGGGRQAPERNASERGADSPRAESPSAPASQPAGTHPSAERSRDAGRSGLADFLSRPFGQANEIPKPSAPRFPAPESEANAANPAGQAPSSVATPRPGAPADVHRPAASPLGTALPAGQRPDTMGALGLGTSRPAPSPESDRSEKVVRASEAPRVKEVAPGEPSPEPARASGSAATTPVQSPAASTSQPRTLEDAVADLLRPMLREWLDSNLPRIVERALRAEMAERAKAQNSGGNTRS